jgi:hypothetical protein
MDVVVNSAEKGVSGMDTIKKHKKDVSMRKANSILIITQVVAVVSFCIWISSWFVSGILATSLFSIGFQYLLSIVLFNVYLFAERIQKIGFLPTK